MKEISNTSGLVGFAGLSITVLGGVLATPVIIVGGGLTLAGAAGWALIRGFPPKLLHPDEIVGKDVSLLTLKQVNPIVPKIGLVGRSSAGKSTLLEHLRHRSDKPSVTDKVYATIIKLQATPPSFIALIDGAGQKYNQQFVVAENANILFIFLDHDDGDSRVALNRSRMDEEDGFLEQLLHYLLGTNTTIERIVFVLNKRDLWERSTNKTEILSWFEAHVAQWKRTWADARKSGDIISFAHSNRISTDVVSLVNQMMWTK